MTSIKVGSDSVHEIDAQKRALELRFSRSFRRLFTQMATDAANIYLATGTVRAEELANNYRPEFLKEIRDIMRKTLKQFGFTIRKTLESKFDLLFDVETKLLEIELDFKKVQRLEDSNTTDTKLEKINHDFLLAASLFVANESEKQVDYITQTNIKDIETGFAVAGALYVNRLAEARQSGNQAETARLQENPRAIIAAGAKKNIIDKGKARSDLIAEQNIGLTESWARQEEAKLINDAELITTQAKVIKLSKSWSSILDNRTRILHAEADGQTVGVNDFFLVGGEQLKYPRDPNGSAGNTIRCRCQSEHSIL